MITEEIKRLIILLGNIIAGKMKQGRTLLLVNNLQKQGKKPGTVQKK